VRHEWSSSAIESEGHRSQVKGPNTYGRGNAVGLTSVLDRGQFFYILIILSSLALHEVSCPKVVTLVCNAMIFLEEYVNQELPRLYQKLY